MGHVYIPAKKKPRTSKVMIANVCVRESFITHTQRNTHTHTFAERESHYACGESCLTYARDIALFLMGIVWGGYS